MFVRGVDVNVSLRETFEQRLNVPFNISMTLNFILEEAHEAFNYSRTKKCFAHM